MTDTSNTKETNDWQAFILKQHQLFFATAEKNLKQLFEQIDLASPEKQRSNIQQALDDLKQQWLDLLFASEKKYYHDYWVMMSTITSDASKQMLNEWIERSHDKNPIKSIQELYEIWLKHYHILYQEYIQLKAKNEAYGEF